MLCKAMTKRNTRCQNPAQPGSKYCRVHAVFEIRQPSPDTRDRRSIQSPTPQTAPKKSDPIPETQVKEAVKTTTLQDLAASFLGSVSEAPSGPSEPSSADAFAALAAAVAAAAAEAEVKGPPDKTPASAPTDVLSRIAYTAGYAVGYGVAFPTCLLMEMLPDNPVSRGLREGAIAAKDSVERMRKGGS